jgi:hypothetical protein
MALRSSPTMRSREAKPTLVAAVPVLLVTLGAWPVAAQPVEDREEPLKQLVVMIRSTVDGSEYIGAGLIFGRASDRLYVVTANHVVRPAGLTAAEDVRVLFRWLPGEWTRALLLTDADPVLDIAVLAVPGAGTLAVPELAWQALLSPDALEAGDRVFPLGYPSGEAWFVPRAPHFVSSVTGEAIRTEGDLVPGHSGGVLATETWDVAGIVSRVGSLLAQVSRIDRVVERLREWGYPVDVMFRDRPSAAGSSTCDVAGSLLTTLSIDPIKNASWEKSYPGLVPGRCTPLAGLAFDIPDDRKSFTTDISLPGQEGKPDEGTLNARIRNPRKVHLLLVLGNGYTTFAGREVGSVTLRFAGGASSRTSLVAGQTLREWCLSAPGVITRTTDPATREAYRETSEGGSCAAAILDVVTVEIPAAHRDDTLTQIVVRDESRQAFGSEDPQIGLFGVAVETQ